MLMIVRIAPIEKTLAEKHSMIKEFKEGVQVIKADRALSVLILVETLCMVFFMPLVLLLSADDQRLFRMVRPGTAAPWKLHMLLA